MDEDAALIESILIEDAKLNGDLLTFDDNTGWKKVSYSRRHRKSTPNGGAHPPPEESSSHEVFRSVDQQAEERRRLVVEAQRVALAAITNGGKEFTGEDSGENEVVVPPSEGRDDRPVKKPKVKKLKKVKVSVVEAADKIDADDLAAFLIDVSGSYESQQDIQLMRFADYFGRCFASVGSTQFPWVKMLKDLMVDKMIEIPLSQVPEAVCKTSYDWLNQMSLDALGPFVLWLWDGILADLIVHQGTVKPSKKVAPQVPPQSHSKSKVALFVVLSMTLRKKPDVLINLLPTLKEGQKYLGQDKLHFTAWVIAQASQGDIVVGLYMWVQVLLPMLNGKSVNPQSRDLILQLVEKILSVPKAQKRLVNEAVRKGERVVPPTALETLMRLTFPSPSARIKATERFEAIYPTLKDVALAGSLGSKAMKQQVTQHIPSIVISTVAKGIPELTKEASEIFFRCLNANPELYKHWDKLYFDNIEASVVLLRKLYDEGKLRSADSSSCELVKTTLNSFRQKNEQAMASKEYADHQASFKEADKYCKSLLAQVSRGHHGCLKFLIVASAVFGIVAVVSKNVQSEDINQLLANFNLQI